MEIIALDATDDELPFARSHELVAAVTVRIGLNDDFHFVSSGRRDETGDGAGG